jgi:hypothetical protein
MGIVARTIAVAGMVTGLALTSQAPEFANQYRQRLGGAIDELRAVIADFDRDADNSRLDRQTALRGMRDSATRFIRDRGESMARLIARHDNLVGQQRSLDQATGMLQPLIVLRNPDSQIVAGAWQDFEPAVPLTAAGAVYGGAGAAAAMVLARLCASLGRGWRRRRRLADAARRKSRESRMDQEMTSGEINGGNGRPGTKARVPVIEPEIRGPTDR